MMDNEFEKKLKELDKVSHSDCTELLHGVLPFTQKNGNKIAELEAEMDENKRTFLLYSINERAKEADE